MTPWKLHHEEELEAVSPRPSSPRTRTGRIGQPLRRSLLTVDTATWRMSRSSVPCNLTHLKRIAGRGHVQKVGL